jgi:outer membrane protein OmpA-like peptidoglycan-associated protein
LLVAGCAGLQVEQDLRQVRAIAKEARENGAYKCAPRELALAESNAEFSARELDQGDYFRARDHLQIADKNAREAYRLSPREHCVAPAAPGDRDHDGIPDNVDKCPDQPEDRDGFEDTDGCPDPDNDKDGILDTDDKCPNEPEDKDGFQDADGCPDPDNDTDGIPDATDKCPNEPEDKDNFEDADGCPDPDNDKDGVPDTADKCPNDPGPPDNDGCPKKYEHIVVTQEKIELKQKIFFDTDKATIQARSFALLDEIANVLKSRPTMTVRIEGHTDARGRRPHNMQLSQARAESVRQHLVGLGIETARMEARGYGPDQPIETNKTAAGREKNRRVEFFITQQ